MVASWGPGVLDAVDTPGKGIGRAGTKLGPSTDAGLRWRPERAGPATDRKDPGTLERLSETRVGIWQCVEQASSEAVALHEGTHWHALL